MSKTSLILPSPNDRLSIPNRKIFTPDMVESMVENASLGLEADFNDNELFNILLDSSHQGLFSDPILEFIDVFSNPDYFYLTCKHLFKTNRC